MTTKRLIGLVGPAGSGKTTVAKMLATHGYTKMAFADPFKKMLLALGVPKANLYGSDIDKSMPLDVLAGKSARYAMQTIGTEWGRKYLKETIWTEHCMARVRDEPFDVVIDDVRHIEEAEAIREAGGLLIRIRRTGAKAMLGADHSSETQLDNIACDHTVSNNWSMTELWVAVETILKRERYWL